MDKQESTPLKPATIVAMLAVLSLVAVSTVWGWWNSRGASGKEDTVKEAAARDREMARRLAIPSPMERIKFVSVYVDFDAFHDLVPVNWANMATSSTPKRQPIEQIRRDVPGPEPFLLKPNEVSFSNATFNENYPEPDPLVQIVSPELDNEFQTVAKEAVIAEGLQSPSHTAGPPAEITPYASLRTIVKTYQFNGLVGFKFDTSISMPTPTEYEKPDLRIYPGRYGTGVYIVERKDALKVMKTNLAVHLRDVLHREITPKAVLSGARPPGTVAP